MTDPEILIKSSGNTGAMLPFEENRVLIRCQRQDSTPSLCFLVSREISDSDLCESKVREREGTFVCVSCNFRQQLQRAAGPHSLQTWPPLNRGQRLAAPCCDIAVSPPGQDCNQASPLNRTLDFSSATFRLALNAASMTSLVGSPFFLAQNDSQSNYLVLTFFLILGDPIAF